MKTCDRCGAPMNDDDLFCGVCGAKVEQPNLPQKTEAFFCPQCGERITEAVTYCPNCGTDVSDITKETQIVTAANHPAVQNGAKAHSWKKNLPKIGIAVVGVLVIAAGIKGIMSLIGGPSKQFVDYQRDFLMEEVVGRLGGGIDKYQDLTELSTDLTLSAQVDDEWINKYLENSSLSLNLDLGKEQLAASGGVNLMGSDVLTAAVEYDKGQLSFAVPELDDHCYTMDTVRVLEDMTETSGLEPISLPDVSSDTLRSLGKAYLNVVLGAANKENVTCYNDKKVNLEVLNQTVKGKTYVFEPSAEDIEAMLQELADMMEEDEELRDFVLSFIGSNQELVSALTGVDDLDALLQDSMSDLSDTLRYNAREIGESMEEAGFRWVMGVSDGRVCLQRIELRQSGQVFGYESYGNEKEERRDMIYAGYDGSANNFELEMVWSKDGSVHNGYITARLQGENLARIDFYNADSEKESALGAWYGDYRLQVYDGDDSPAFDMNISVEEGQSGGTDHIFSVDGLSRTGLVNFDSLDVTLNSSDKKATITKPSGTKVDVTDYSFFDWNEFANNWERTLQQQILNNLPV